MIVTDLNISSGEVRELLFYMQKVKSFEQIYDLQMDSMVRMIWGVLLVMAGILIGFLLAYCICLHYLVGF
ncbi:MAG: hypothetical protein ACFFBD_05045 [Candidatus Hodarchaeota archaeon]